MTVRCGKGHDHESVADVRECYGITGFPQTFADYKENMYPGNCRKCGAKVEANQGRVDKIDGKWLTSHLDGKCPEKPPLQKAQSLTNTDRYDGIPKGHYATASLTGNNDFDFWRIDRPEQGQYAGRTFVKRVVGGKPDMNVSRDTKFAALEAILEIGTEVSATLYGRELGRCYRCNRHLTDQTSRRLGIGPECRSKM
jgi:hypothetical protein